jgi:hypothetical protein
MTTSIKSRAAEGFSLCWGQQNRVVFRLPYKNHNVPRILPNRIAKASQSEPIPYSTAAGAAVTKLPPSEAVPASECFSPTNSLSESAAKFAAIFNLTPIECKTIVASDYKVLDKTRI